MGWQAPAFRSSACQGTSRSPHGGDQELRPDAVGEHGLGAAGTHRTRWTSTAGRACAAHALRSRPVLASTTGADQLGDPFVCCRSFDFGEPSSASSWSGRHRATPPCDGARSLGRRRADTLEPGASVRIRQHDRQPGRTNQAGHHARLTPNRAAPLARVV